VRIEGVQLDEMASPSAAGSNVSVCRARYHPSSLPRSLRPGPQHPRNPRATATPAASWCDWCGRSSSRAEIRAGRKPYALPLLARSSDEVDDWLSVAAFSALQHVFSHFLQRFCDYGRATRLADKSLPGKARDLTQSHCCPMIQTALFKPGGMSAPSLPQLSSAYCSRIG
jgi:hypothetical protein